MSARVRLARPAPATLALLAVLALAAVLRLVGLGFGLRHPPHSDERVFVESVRAMMAAGDLDHRYYEYPGLVFYLLVPVLWLWPGAAEGGPAAYLGARALIAACGTTACALVYLWARRVAGEGPALMAALLLAVSPVAVETAHTLRPDVVLHAAALVALIAFRRLGPSLRGDVLAGAALGAAGAVKFSAALLVPAYLLARALAPGRAWRGVVAAGTVAVAAFLLFTPYAALHPVAFFEGVRVQVGYHYEDTRAPVGFGPMLLQYLRVAGDAVGLPAVLLALAGVALARDRWREVAPAAVYFVASVMVLATSDVRHERFLLPALPAVFLLAALGTERLLRAPLALAIGALAVASVPFRASLNYLQQVSRPGTRDRAVDWVHRELPPRALVVSSVPLLGLDPARVEVLEVPRLGPENRVQVLEADLVLATPGDDPQALAGLERAFHADHVTRTEGPVITAWRVPAALRPGYRRLHLDGAALRASENEAELGYLRDGRADTLWRTEDAQEAGDWVEVALPAEERLARVELVLGDHARFSAREAGVLVSSDGQRFTPVRTLPGRAQVQTAGRGEPSQVLLLAPPVPARAVRVVLVRPGGRRWGVAELRLDALPP